MLYWASRPDPVFTQIVTGAMEEAIPAHAARAVAFEAPQREHVHLPRLFTHVALHREIKRLFAAHHSLRIFLPSDYHWPLVHAILRVFCGVYNDGSIVNIVYKRTTIRRIEFEELLDSFFWDLDFTIPVVELADSTAKAFLGVSDQSFNVAAGLAPHPDELTMKEVSEPDWGAGNDGQDDPFFRPGCEIYPWRAEGERR